MDQQNLLIIMAAFVVISAIALCIQAGFLFAIFKAIRGMEAKTAPLIPKMDALVESSRAAIEESRTQIRDITQKTMRSWIRNAQTTGARRRSAGGRELRERGCRWIGRRWYWTTP